MTDAPGRRWRVAILGLGHWYSAYNLARALREYPKAELIAAAWHDRPRLDEFTSTFDVDGYEDYGALLERERIDIVHISAPPSEIPELLMLAIRAGAHVVLGKPMAMTLADADRMVEAVRGSKILCFPLQGNVRLRVADLKARIDAGEIGDVAVMHQTCRWSIAEDWYNSGTPGWFADPKQVPGGAFVDEGIYWIDLFRWITGSEVVEVEARTANLVHKDIGVEDWGLATFTFANRVVATLEASWTINAPVKTAPSPKQNAVVRLEVIGTRGEIVDQWFRAPGRAVLSAGARDWVYERQSVEPFTPGLPGPLAHVIDCLENGTQPISTIEDARRSFAAAMAAYESARLGRAVRLNASSPGVPGP